MSLRYIIDGYNFLNHPAFRKTGLRKEALSRLALINFIKSNKLCGSRNNTVTVVFDGYPGREDLASDSLINVIFSRDESADKRIIDIVGRLEKKKNAVVISDDKEIRIFVRGVGSRSIGVEEFIDSKSRPRHKAKQEAEDVELNYTQMHKINEELKKIWLK